MSGAKKDYNFKTKNDWRGWVWNRAVEILAKKKIAPRDAIVVGLFGSDALDIEWAVKRGFQLKNLFSVERDAKAAKAQRQLGVNTIIGELEEVLWHWRKEPKINFVLADMCAGMIYAVWRRLTDALISSTHIDGCIAINLLRGRERSATVEHMRADAAAFSSCLESKSEHHKNYRYFSGGADISKHRGFWFAKNAVLRFSNVVYEGKLKFLERLNYDPIPSFGSEDFELNVGTTAHFVFDKMRPAYFTYRSGSLSFDSVVLEWPITLYDGRLPKSEEHTMAVQHDAEAVFDNTDFELHKSAISKIAAAKALRTMRLKA
jgi:hypothetical protein